jgi:hypothetical protein
VMDMALNMEIRQGNHEISIYQWLIMRLWWSWT